jgi:hypothetical protein
LFLFFLISSHQSHIYTITHIRITYSTTHRNHEFNHSTILRFITGTTNQNSQEHVHKKPLHEPNLHLTHGRHAGEGRPTHPLSVAPTPSRARRRGGRRSWLCGPRRPSRPTPAALARAGWPCRPAPRGLRGRESKESVEILDKRQKGRDKMEKLRGGNGELKEA